MRETSIYCFECVCGQKIETPATTVLCSNCGIEIRLNWRPDVKLSPSPVTITEKYEK